MKNTIRCCISCILPCGALDVIRVVHSDGRVEEFSGTIRASEIMKAYPKHVLKKPSVPSDDGAVIPRIVIVPPDEELQRGKIYFLMPAPVKASRSSRSSSARKKKKESDSNANNNISVTSLLLSDDDQYLSEILSEKKVSTQRDRRRGRVGVWRPHLQSISEGPSDA